MVGYRAFGGIDGKRFAVGAEKAAMGIGI